MNLEIKKIAAAETLFLRQKVLKPFATLQECILAEDHHEATLHLGLFINATLVTIATFYPEPHPDFSTKRAFRLRGMATEFAYQGRGLGQKILQQAFAELEKQGGDFIWFNARTSALSFYRKLDCKEHGSLFEIPKIGPHKVMYKKLNPR